MPICEACGQENATKCCSRCREACYCSSACQKQHWKEGHKAECKKLREAHEKEQQQRRYLIPGKKLVKAPASD